MHQKVRHEREGNVLKFSISKHNIIPPTDCHSSMLNITARIAVRIKRVPDWSFEWSDITPQRSLDSLTTVDFLPSEQDGDELKKRAVRYMKQFLVNEFNSLTHHLKQFVPEEPPREHTEPDQVVPMKVLFKDEKYTAETIDILSQIAKDAKLDHFVPQVSFCRFYLMNIKNSVGWVL